MTSTGAGKDEVTKEPINAVSPYGWRYPFHCLFKCFARRILLDDNRYYDIFCNNFVYTTDGRMFMGNYIGSDGIEDLDPFIMVSVEDICCICCVYCCCEKLANAWLERQMTAWQRYNEEKKEAL